MVTFIPMACNWALMISAKVTHFWTPPSMSNFVEKLLGELRLSELGFGLGQAELQDRRAGRVVLEAWREERAPGLGCTEARRVHQGRAVDGISYGAPDVPVGELG